MGYALPPTSATLLGRLRTEKADGPAWKEFVERYTPLLHAWCRTWGVKPADEEDVIQAVLLKLVVRFRDDAKPFQYDPTRSFRAYLREITKNASLSFHSDRKMSNPQNMLADSEDALRSIEARDDLMRRLDEENERHILELAMEDLQLRVDPASWSIFHACVFEELPTKVVAERHGKSIGAVDMVKYRLKEMLKETIARLNGEDGN